MDSFEAAGRRFTIVRSLSRNRNAWARLRGDVLTISIPSRWPESEKRRLGEDLLRKSIRSIEKGKWTGESVGKVCFFDGQRIRALGKEFEIIFKDGKRFGAKVCQGTRIEVSVDPAHPKKHEKASAMIKARIIRLLMPDLVEKVKRINDSHFQAALGRINMRDNTSRWGSCSRSGSISLNLRLLFMPEGILDYVVVHELAHTKYRSHGPRFWALVESVMPDHKDRRRWLKDNGWSYPKDEAGQGTDLAKEIAEAKREGQLSISDFVYEEQY